MTKALRSHMEITVQFFSLREFKTSYLLQTGHRVSQAGDEITQLILLKLFQLCHKPLDICSSSTSAVKINNSAH